MYLRHQFERFKERLQIKRASTYLRKMNLFPGDYVASLLPLVGTLVPGEGHGVNLNIWETRLSASLGGEAATTRSNGTASSLDVRSHGAIFKVVKVSKVVRWLVS